MQHFYTDKNKFPENWFTFPNLYSSFVNELKDGDTMVEIGSYKGQSTVYMAVEICNSNKDIRFYAIDTWEGSKENKDKSSVHFSANLDDLYNTYVNNISSVQQYITNIRADSVMSASMFKEKSINIAFIDACHEYECVYNDIIAWLPKIKNGGILAGHDYNHNWPGVNKAVDNLLGANNIQTSEFCWIYRVGQ